MAVNIKISTMRLEILIKGCSNVSKTNKDKVSNKLAKRVTCDLCNQSYVSIHTLRNHMQVIHLNERMREYPNSRLCGFCQKFVLDEHYQEHVKAKHKKLRCEVCQRVYFNAKPFKNHVKTHRVQYCCDICNHKFTVKSSVKKHIIENHLGKIPRSKCEHCGKMILSRMLRFHIKRVHKKQKDHACHVCGKSFFNLPNLRKHLAAVHLNQQNNVCTICNKNFIYKNILDRHYHGVHGTRPRLDCKKCERTFGLPQSLRRHLNCHEKLPFTCTRSACFRMFKTEEARNRHIKNFHDNPIPSRCMTLSCDKCNKTFKRSDALKTHVRTDHLKLLYECHFCEQQYKYKQTLIKHLFKNHVVDQ